MSPISIEPISENALLLVWPEKIEVEQHQYILAFQKKLTSDLKEYTKEFVSAYNSLVIYYDFTLISYSSIAQKVLEICHSGLTIDNDLDNEKVIEIPVYYSLESGWDLLNVAKQLKVSVEEVIDMHSNKPYRAYALGFTPGFCYLASVHQRLQLPRLNTPRAKIPKGAVAIAEQQTAIYPNESPGGWHILGQTPIEMYCINQTSGEFEPKVHIGHNIRFKPIDLEEFYDLGGNICYE